MKEEKIEEWAKLLLDFGKRNNLINFKDSKRSSAEIVFPNVDSIFDKAQGDYKFEVYDPKIVFESVEGNQQDEEILNKEEFIAKFSPKITKEKSILVYNKYSPIFACKEIMKKAKSVIEETGNNISNLSFGIMHWKENKQTIEEYKAPLLLIPIKIERCSITSPFIIETMGEDVIVNPTLSHFLSDQYGITLPEYKDQTFSNYLEEVRKKIHNLGWKVTNECKIGLFSFAKINMYLDLINNKSSIGSNSIIKFLLDQNNTLESSENKEQKEIVHNPLIDLHNVVDADSSQIDAIEMAKSNKSFVLQGPPGTGKSQTITNIIAECLHDGKKVLFVSEKLAALNVVYDKLKKAGLEDFCLELHSHKANKKDFISTISESLNSKRTTIDKKALQDIINKENYINELDNYENELHKNRRVINQSLYMMYSNYFSCKDVQEEDSFAIKDIETKDETYLKKVVDILNQYSEFSNFLGYNYQNNCWYGYIDRDNSYYKQTELKNKLSTIIGELKSINEQRTFFNNKYKLTLNSVNDMRSINGFFGLLSASEFITPAILDMKALSFMCDKLEGLKTESRKIIDLKEELSLNYDDDIIDINAVEYERKLSREYTSSLKRLFSREYKDIIKELRLKNKNGKKEKYNNALSLLKNIIEHNNLSKSFEENDKNIKTSLGSAYQGIYTDWEELLKELTTLKMFFDKGINFGTLSIMPLEEYNDSKPSFLEFNTLINNFNSNYIDICGYLANCFNKDLFDIYNNNLDYVIRKLEDCELNIDNLNNWIDFIKLLDDAKEFDLIDFIDKSINLNIPSKDVSISYKKSFYHQWIENIIRKNKILSNFNCIKHNKCVEDFRIEDHKHFEINKLKIRSILYKNRPSLDVVPANSPIGIIRHEAGKKKKQKTIRTLLSETGKLIQNLKPCFLMSPLSVSTYIDSKCVEFDTVIFDEASQIFPQDAIGSIYRGKQLIVVGDSKQMPPSNYFNTSIESEEYNDDDDDDITNYESILDLCATSFPQKSLRWHYRSKYEDLISFSNNNFYGGQLITFPSSTTDIEDTGVDYYRVNGVYERNAGINRIEAEKIVDLVFEHAKKYPNRSLGVVAFNIKQQSLIEDLIYKRREMNHSCEDFFNSNNVEPFFVKNLETVQGDERDTILFGITFAKDSNGRFINQFGPLNKVGGERRLNVAVTRAKINIKVVTSISYTDIAVTENLGPKILRQFLDFAENGNVALFRDIDVKSEDKYDSEFEMEVCDFLRHEGFTVDTQVGCSSFRIDMCIRIPDTSKYVLAIECDGATYHSSKNARDRDRLRQEILESMGWKFYRIWSTDWYKNKQKSKEKLLEAAKSAIKNIKSGDSKENTVSLSFEEIKQEFEKECKAKTRFPRYVMNDDSKIRRERNYINILNMIMEKEAPISEDWLIKRTLGYFGREKVTVYVLDKFETIMDLQLPSNMIRKNGFIYYRNSNKYQLRLPTTKCRREIEDISLEELAAGLYEIIKENVTVDKNSLYSTIVKMLGFSKMTDDHKLRLNFAVKTLKNKVKVDKNIIKLVH